MTNGGWRAALLGGAALCWMQGAAHAADGAAITAAADTAAADVVASDAADAAGDAGDARDDILVVGQAATLNKPAATGSRLGITPLETPASIAVLTGDAIRAAGDMSVVEAVSRAPGVVNVGNPGNGGTALAMRGFAGQGSVLQLVDGIRLFPAADTITFPSDPWNIDRIEVLSGPASVLYGQGALGGAINVITKQPDATRQSFDATASYGSQNTAHVGVGAGGPIAPMLSYRVDASYRRSDGIVERGNSRSLALSGALRFQPSDALSITLRDDYGDNRPSKYFGTPLVNGKLDTSIRKENYNVADAVMRWKDNRTLLTVDWKVSDAINFSNTAYRLTSDRRWMNAEYYESIGGTPARVYRADYLGIRHDQEQIGNQGALTVKTPLGGEMKNDLVVGFDYNRIKLVYSHDFPPSAPYIETEVALHDPVPGNYQGVGVIPRRRSSMTEYSFFAEDRLSLSDQLSIVGGIRHERDKVKRVNFTYNANGTVTEQDAFGKRIYTNTTWRVGAVYQPTPNISLYGQYATGVDPISTLLTINAGDFNYDNATGDQIEGGVKALFLDGKGSVTLAAYRIVKKGLLYQQTPLSPILQIGQRSSKGIEASFSLDLPAGFGIDANGTVLDAKYDDFVSGGTNYTGNTPPGTPETAANLALRYSGIDRVQLRGQLRYVGGRYADNANSARVPSYTVVDTSVGFALTEAVAVEARLSNIFDRDYAVSTYNSQWILGRPRSIDVSVRARF